MIKWPGGKAGEIKYIEHLIPEFDRYIEPFFGGGAMFFFLKPHSAIINDISADLIDFYTMVKEQNAELREYLVDYCVLFDDIICCCDAHIDELLEVYGRVKDGLQSEAETVLGKITDKLCSGLSRKA
ncbi:MAG: DNA adenine methylase, partial [Oscillospiraceae bacterium]|nr:DNA adenine methylase [Oscillospiraceae bacterium]